MPRAGWPEEQPRGREARPPHYRRARNLRILRV